MATCRRFVRKGGRKTALGRGRSWSVTWLPLTSQPVLQGFWSWGGLHSLPNEGKGVRPVHAYVDSHWMQADWVGTGGKNFVKTASSAEGGSWEGSQLWSMSRPHCLEPWKTVPWFCGTPASKWCSTASMTGGHLIAPHKGQIYLHFGRQAETVFSGQRSFKTFPVVITNRRTQWSDRRMLIVPQEGSYSREHRSWTQDHSSYTSHDTVTLRSKDPPG